MMEKIKAKFEQTKQWVSHRFDLDNKFGRVMTNIALSEIVIARKVSETAVNIGNNIKNELRNFREDPKEYLQNKLEGSKNKLEVGKVIIINKIEIIKENLSKTPEINEGFVDRLSGWYRKQAENVFNFEKNIYEWRLQWEIKKLEVIKDNPGRNELKIMIINKIDELNKKRAEYKRKSECQKEVNLQFGLALAAA